MKNMKTLLIAILIAGTFGFQGETQAAPHTNKVKALLNKVMNYPDFAKKSKSTGIVFVSFERLEDGSIEV